MGIIKKEIRGTVPLSMNSKKEHSITHNPEHTLGTTMQPDGSARAPSLRGFRALPEVCGDRNAT